MTDTNNVLIKMEGVKKVFLHGRSGNARAGGDSSRDPARASISRLPGHPAAASRRCCRFWDCWIRRPKGSYLLNGQPVANLTASERTRIRNREIGFIFQAFNLIGDLTVYENVELPLTYRGMQLGGAQTEACSTPWKASAWRTACGIIPRNFPAVSNSAWPWPAHWLAIPRSCWPTSPPETWTRRTARPSWNCCATCTATAPPFAW